MRILKLDKSYQITSPYEVSLLNQLLLVNSMQEIARAAKIIPALEYASLSTLSVAKYPYPADAHPIVGWLPGQDNVYVAVTHSGATLGPLLGRLVAEEILGSEQDLLQHYRPDRDFSSTAHLYWIQGRLWACGSLI